MGTQALLKLKDKHIQELETKIDELKKERDAAWERCIDAFVTVCLYNGYSKIISDWCVRCKNAIDNKDYSIPCPLGVSNDFEFGQIQVLWMILVEWFGDYGTSPRYGWIENKDSCHKFLQEVEARLLELESESPRHKED